MTNDILFEIAPAVQAQFPGIRCAGFRAAGLRSLDIRDDAIDAGSVRDRLAAQGFTVDRVTEDSRIAAWRSAIQRCGLKAAKVRGSAEQLVRRYIRGDEIGGPSLVRAYCAVSAASVAPLGGYDVAQLPSSTIELRFADDADTFEPLGGDASAMPLAPTIPVYAAERTVLCWMFNVRDARMTALSDATKEALFLSEALTPLQEEASQAALTALHSLLAAAGATVGPIGWDDGGRAAFTSGG